jgi:predicted nucleotidyltransferase
VLLRLPLDLHRDLAKAAAARGLSFNEFCVRRLRSPASLDDTLAVRTLVTDRARAAFGDRLAGVLLIGSWARGDAGAASDIDVLVVIDPSLPLTRDLYRTWDRAPLSWEGRAVDAHFAHLPGDGARPSAVWCEAAVDGIVWYDRDGAVGRRLGEIRRAIADGRVVRGVAHGQPYWKGAA